MRFSIAQIARVILWVAFAMAGANLGGIVGGTLTWMFLMFADFFTRQMYRSWSQLSRSERSMAIFASVVSLLSFGLFFGGLMSRSSSAF